MSKFLANRGRRRAAWALATGIFVCGGAHADVQSARQAMSANDYPAAITQLNDVLAQTPDNVEARFLKGLALARSGDTKGALTVFNALVKDDPDMAEAWNNLGVLRARNGDLTGARDALQRATQTDPEHGPAQENLGDIYVALARNAYRRAGELETDNAIARAKSQQLAAFIGSGQDASETSQSTGTRRTAASPPAVAGVSENAESTAAADDNGPKAALQRWASAWSAQNVDAYLAMYSDRFVPDDGASRSAWASERRQRLTAPSRIQVTLDDIRVETRGDQALVRFDQRYRSNTYQDHEVKALLMRRSDDGWRILREGKASAVDFTAPAEHGSGSAAIPAQTPGNESDAARAQGSDPARMQAASQAEATRGAVRRSLQAWAQAWSSQNLQAYLNAYSDNYQPSEGVSRVDWVQTRRAAVRTPAWIRVEISDLDVSVLDGDRALATFNQHYQSDGHEDRERKRVTLVQEDGGWRIVREG
ncbi:tetratricopeptide repeat protein [Salinisphaera sp. T31B1]|uniref:nuclear transport factor 2 family protein n=1 Tax=Salinisphaera sp. T31B1 TaxID=727963 RepID=UPI0033410431